MEPRNLLFILSDQHNRDFAGCYGHPLIRTPHLDRLAERGTRFTAAYTPCPICVPARAALATGRHVYQIGYWDNAFPYDGRVPSWGHRLREQGFQVDSIGKLHFRGQGDDHGFSQEIDPLQVVDGVGDILGCIRAEPPFRDKRSGILEAGPGDSTYLRYDASNGDQACRWLADRANDEQPWVLFLSFVCPHPPYVAPEELYELYPPDQIPLPPQWRPEQWPDHPALDYFRRFFGLAEPFEEAVIRKMVAAYMGVCTYLDRQIGRVLQQLEDQNLGGTTRIIYSSDHGESAGARGLFGKFTMYEEAAAVPLLLAGPDVPAGKVVNTPVSLVDCFPTVLEAVGATPAEEDRSLPGRSLWAIAREDDQDRTVFSEYHALGTRQAIYMLRDGRYKYVHYLDEPPQLFDLIADPAEESDLAGLAAYQTLVRLYRDRLYTLLDPVATDTRARADQTLKVEAFGGREAVIKRGAFTNSPVPGEEPAFHRYSSG